MCEYLRGRRCHLRGGGLRPHAFSESKRASAQVLAVDNCAETGYRNATTTPELTQGPYHLDEAFFRTNVTENQDGIKLHLFLSVRDTNCVPIADAIVEIWHANASGYYSGIAGRYTEVCSNASALACDQQRRLKGCHCACIGSLEVNAPTHCITSSMVQID